MRNDDFHLSDDEFYLSGDDFHLSGGNFHLSDCDLHLRTAKFRTIFLKNTAADSMTERVRVFGDLFDGVAALAPGDDGDACED